VHGLWCLLPNPEFRLALQRRGGDINLLNDVFDELTQARAGHAPMHSAHEAYAVILEEVREFEAEVFKKTGARSRRDMYQELVQIAAMAVRAAVDLDLLDG
jgi:hypothetical protein